MMKKQGLANDLNKRTRDIKTTTTTITNNNNKEALGPRNFHLGVSLRLVLVVLVGFGLRVCLVQRLELLAAARR